MQLNELQVPERTRISCKPTPEEDDEWADDVPAVQPQIRDAAYVGESGIGLLWRPAQNETLGQELSILFKRDDNEDADVFSESEEESEEEGEDEEKTFHSELVETVVRHFKDPGHNTENLMVEVNSLKFSYNATISQCADGLSEALMSVTSIGGDGFSLRVMLKHWSASIIRWICHYILCGCDVTDQVPQVLFHWCGSRKVHCFGLEISFEGQQHWFFGV
jgi:hypothetical protein